MKKETNENTLVNHRRLSACLEIRSKHFESTFYPKRYPALPSTNILLPPHHRIPKHTLNFPKANVIVNINYKNLAFP